MQKKVGYNKCNQFLISAEKRITKDCLSLQKINVKRVSHYFPDHTFQFPSIGRESAAFIIC